MKKFLMLSFIIALLMANTLPPWRTAESASHAAARHHRAGSDMLWQAGSRTLKRI